MHGARMVHTVLGYYTAFTPQQTPTERYWTATSAPRKQPGTGYLIILLHSKLNQGDIWVVHSKMIDPTSVAANPQPPASLQCAGQW